MAAVACLAVGGTDDRRQREWFSMNKSHDYHDYVFRDGQLVGEFEQMYRNSATVPWHQDEQADWMDVRLTKEMIRDIGERLDEIHDLGCGTGHYLNLIATEFLTSHGKGFGYDISQTAQHKAAAAFPQFTFSVLDLTNPAPTDRGSAGADSGNQQARRLFMIRGTLWYVYPHLRTVIDNIERMMTDNDRLLVVQNFPPLDSHFIGKDVIPNHLALIDHFSRLFTLDRHIWYEDRFETSNDNWFIGLFSPAGQ